MSFHLKAALPAKLALSALLLAAAPSALADDEMLSLGKEVFTQQAMPSCTICHALQDAGSAGAVGPDLDDLKPSAEQVSTAVKSGIGVMPAFAALSEEQVKAVAHYVSTVAGQ